ncbi:MAG TPA: membrane protein insertion efficiency factor YidD [Terriglobales bacterium]|nr:membrane protein insertion efficiency factor YidD [Terriglobales bacterium]
MRRITSQLVLLLLRGYKRAISPWLQPACRYVPTCSEYAMEAVERYGALRGTAMALLRLLRCHPFATGGYDPVGDGRLRPVSRTAPEAQGQDPVPQGTGAIR